MTVQAWERVKELLHRALQLDPAAREQFLDQACAGDASLRNELESLLRAGDEVRSGFLASTPANSVDSGGGQFPSPLTEGEIFAERFRLIRKLGEGGMGQVWLAEQMFPVRRQIALKLIKAGMYDEAVVQRFQSERQSLAIMDHPAIAKVFDAGTTPQGQPYFVMEYVPGLPITEYCDRNKLKIAERLELFIQACEGVQHAHQKAILHRDLKPANILVVDVDGKPTPRIIDFGLAKATTPQLGEESMFTQMGMFVGTPGYMSPEQADSNVHDVDTRTDVYSLGVILYVLLAGMQPFESRQRQKPSLEELLRRLREEEPPRPSTKVGVERIESASTADARSTAPRQLASMLRGDLDWITLKALEKDRARRYGTPSDLAADIRRHLNHEPVTARPASVSYQLRKYAQRHRALVAGAAAVLAVLLAGIAASTAFAIRASRARQEAIHELDRAVQAEERTRHERDRAAAAEQTATHQRDIAVEAQQAAIREQNRALAEQRRADDQAATAMAETDFLEKDLLSQAGARGQVRSGIKLDPDLKVRTALDRAASNIAGKFDKQPLVEASIEQTIGATYRELGAYAESRKHLERAVELRRRIQGDKDPATLKAIYQLDSLDQFEGKYKQAETEYKQLLADQQKVLGKDNTETLDTAFQLGTIYQDEQDYPRAEQVFSPLFDQRRRVLGEDNPDTLYTALRLATVYELENNYAKAEPLLTKTLDAQQRVLGAEHPDTLMAMHDLASVYWGEGKYALAEPLMTKALEAQRRELGEEHRETLYGMNTLATLFELEGKSADAEKLFVHALEIETRIEGEDHEDTFSTMLNLSAVYQNEGKYGDAERLALKCLEIRRRLGGEESKDTLVAYGNLGTVYFRESKYSQAAPLFEKVLELRRRLLGAEDRRTLLSMTNLCEIYKVMGEYDKAEPLAIKTLEIRRRLLGENDLETAVSTHALGSLYRMEGKYDLAEPLLLRALEIRRSALGNEHPATLGNIYDLAALRKKQGRLTEAETMFATVVEGRRRVLGATHPDTLEAMTAQGEVRLKLEKLVDAEAVLRESETSYEKTAPESWQRFRNESLLGASLARRSQFAEAEPLLLAGYRGMAGQMDAIPFELRVSVGETRQEIARMYETWGKAAQAAEWKQTALSK